MDRIFQSSALLGSILFVSSMYVFGVARHTSRSLFRRNIATRPSVDDVISRIEERIQRDDGKRGIGCLVIPGELSIAANDCLKARNVVIITGFPCLVDCVPPTETDGPLGALAIARALLTLGNNKVSILTDECNEEVMLAASAASGLFEKYKSRFNLESFPALPTFDEADQARLNKLADQADLLIAIERTGPSRDGRYLTMRAIDMSHIVAPLDDIIARRSLMETSENNFVLNNRGFRSIGIGDGGNEVGMGKVYDRIVASTILNGANIGCVVPTSSLIVASVSNWGGYALAGAIVAKACCSADAIFKSEDLPQKLEEAMVTSQQETLICQRMIDARARDGITKEKLLMVDGFPLSTSLTVLEDIRRLVLSLMA